MVGCIHAGSLLLLLCFACLSGFTLYLRLLAPGQLGFQMLASLLLVVTLVAHPWVISNLFD